MRPPTAHRRANAARPAANMANSRPGALSPSFTRVIIVCTSLRAARQHPSRQQLSLAYHVVWGPRIRSGCGDLRGVESFATAVQVAAVIHRPIRNVGTRVRLSRRTPFDATAPCSDCRSKPTCDIAYFTSSPADLSCMRVRQSDWMGSLVRPGEQLYQSDRLPSRVTVTRILVADWLSG